MTQLVEVSVDNSSARVAVSIGSERGKLKNLHCVRSRCQETANDDCNRLRTMCVSDL
jgi:hypothetical protein